MPIPLIVWGIAAAGAAYLGYKNKDKIAEWTKSEGGQKVIDALGKGMESFAAPYEKTLSELVEMGIGKRTDTIAHLKATLPSDQWSRLVSYAKHWSARDIRNVPVYMALLSKDSDA